MPVNSPELTSTSFSECATYGSAVLDLAVGGRDDLHDRQAEPLREREVALVVRGHGHDRAGAVVHQHVVGDPDRDPLVVHGVDGVEAGEDARLLLARERAPRSSRRRRGARTRAISSPFSARSAKRSTSGCSGASTKNVAPNSVSGRVVKTGTSSSSSSIRKMISRALGAADPVALHRQHALGPRLEQRHLVEQPVGVVGDPEHPLLEVPRLDLGAAALAVAVDHLLVREHGLVVRAPLDRRRLAVGEARLVQLQEEPLRPAVVLGLVRRDLARPVDRPAHALDLARGSPRCCARSPRAGGRPRGSRRSRPAGRTRRSPSGAAPGSRGGAGRARRRRRACS